MTESLTYSEERELIDRLIRSFGDWTEADLELLNRAWLKKDAVAFASLVQLAAHEAQKDQYP